MNSSVVDVKERVVVDAQAVEADLLSSLYETSLGRDQGDVEGGAGTHLSRPVLAQGGTTHGSVVDRTACCTEGAERPAYEDAKVLKLPEDVFAYEGRAAAALTLQFFP